jgi:hypothetical protein
MGAALLRQPSGFEGLGSILVVVHAGEQSSPHCPNLCIGPSKFEVGGAPDDTLADQVDDPVAAVEQPFMFVADVPTPR